MRSKNKLNDSKIEISNVNKHIHQWLESITNSWESASPKKKASTKAEEVEKQKFYDLFSDAPSCMGLLIGPNHKYQMANPMYLKLIGKKKVIGKTVKEIMPEIIGQGYLDILDKVYKTGKTFSANEMLIKLKASDSHSLEDHYLNFVYQAHRNSKDDIDGILFFANDVTELVVSREKNKNSEVKLNEAQSLGHIGSFEVDLITNKVIWSKEQYSQLGLKINEVTPSSELFFSFIHPDDSESVTKRFHQVFETFEDSSNSYRIMMRNGRVKYLHTTWRFEFDENKKPIRLYGISQDITERKTAEIEIRALNESLEMKVRARTHELFETNLELETFNHSVSHDLQIPLRAIELFTQALLENYKGQLDNDGKKYLLSILKSTHEMSLLIHGLLNFSKLGKIEIVKNEVNMNNLVKNAIEEIKASNGEPKYKIILRKMSNTLCDSNLVKQVWINLISNAIKYSSKKKSPVIEIGSTIKAGIVVYFIKDNGVGFNMKFANKIFGIFERLHSSREFEGTGIGLSNVQRVVNRHGGKIWAESIESKGASFYFTLNH